MRYALWLFGLFFVTNLSGSTFLLPENRSQPNWDTVDICPSLEFDRTLWAFHSGKGVFRLREKKWEFVGLADKVPNQLHITRSGRLLAACDVNLFEWRNGQWIPLLPTWNQIPIMCTSVAEEEDDTLLVPCLWGLWRLKSGVPIQLYTSETMVDLLRTCLPSVTILPVNNAAGYLYTDADMGIVPLMSMQLGKAFIRSVVPGSPAQRAGALPGDEMLAVNNKPIKLNSSNDFLSGLTDQGILKIRRGTQFLELDLRRIEGDKLEWNSPIFEPIAACFYKQQLLLLNYHPMLVRMQRTGPEAPWNFDSMLHPLHPTAINNIIWAGQRFCQNQENLLIALPDNLIILDDTQIKAKLTFEGTIENINSAIGLCVIKLDAAGSEKLQLHCLDELSNARNSPTETISVNRYSKVNLFSDGRLWLHEGRTCSLLDLAKPVWRKYPELTYRAQQLNGDRWFIRHDGKPTLITLTGNTLPPASDFPDIRLQDLIVHQNKVFAIGTQLPSGELALTELTTDTQQVICLKKRLFENFRIQKKTDHTAPQQLLAAFHKIWIAAQSNSQSEQNVQLLSLPLDWNELTPESVSRIDTNRACLQELQTGQIAVFGSEAYFFNPLTMKTDRFVNEWNFNPLTVRILPSTKSHPLLMISTDLGILHVAEKSFIAQPPGLPSGQNILDALSTPAGILITLQKDGLFACLDNSHITITLPAEIHDNLSKTTSSAELYNDETLNLWININGQAWCRQAEQSVKTVEWLTTTGSLTEPASLPINWKINTNQNENSPFSSWRLNNGPWSPWSTQTAASLHDLHAGKHTIEVQTMDWSGNLSRTDALAIHVALPLWKNPILLLLEAAIAILLVLFWRSQIRHAREKQRFEDEKIIAGEKAIRETRENFFTNISHELRTPLTLIVNPLAGLAKEQPDNPKIARALNNSQRMLRLINELLDFKKLEAKELKANPEPCDAALLVAQIVDSFSDQAEAKGIELTWTSSDKTLPATLDRAMFEKVLWNLLSNAIKNTPTGGRILLNIEYRTRNDEVRNQLQAKGELCSPLHDSDFLVRPSLFIEVSDTGRGIPEEEQKDLFTQFYQTKGSEGTGLGLALCKQLVELNGGTISFVSKVGEGTTFTVKWPVVLAELSIPSIPSIPSSLSPSPSARLLIVEDNPELRAMLCEELIAAGHSVVAAENGLVALEKLKEAEVDIILSDVMMPVMGGLEFARQVRSNLETSHLPLLLITARGSEQAQFEGITSGADDYILKPFSTPILLAKIANILERRRLLRQNLADGNKSQETEKQLCRKDQEFITTLMEIITDHLDDEAFGVNELADEMKLSRATLNRKVPALTGENTSDLIRNLRLTKAIELLNDGETIETVSAQVGYSTPRSFLRAFKARYGLTPSEYRKS